MKLTFNVELEDGTKHRVTTAYADILALEDEFDIDASDLVSRQKAAWLAYLAWHALKRKNLIDIDFKTFRTQVEAVEPENTAEGNA